MAYRTAGHLVLLAFVAALVADIPRAFVGAGLAHSRVHVLLVLLVFLVLLATIGLELGECVVLLLEVVGGVHFVEVLDGGDGVDTLAQVDAALVGGGVGGTRKSSTDVGVDSYFEGELGEAGR